MRFEGKMPGLRGFTLVEMTMVMLIAGILAVLLAPRLVDRSAFENRGFYDQVISTLRYAQKVAIAQNRFVCVEFASNGVSLTYDPTSPGVNHTAMAACPGGTALADPGGLSSYTVTSGSASFSSIPAAFYFDALGRPSVASRQVINIANVTDSIYVEAETGYVH